MLRGPYTEQGDAATTMVFGASVFCRSSDDPASTELDTTLSAKVDNLGPKYKQALRAVLSLSPLSPEVRYGIGESIATLWVVG